MVIIESTTLAMTIIVPGRTIDSIVQPSLSTASIPRGNREIWPCLNVACIHPISVTSEASQGAPLSALRSSRCT